MSSKKPQIGALSFVMRHVADVAAARAFYTETLGLTIIDEQPAFFQCAPQGGQGASFAVGQRTTDAPDEVELWWEVTDLDATYAALLVQGVTISEPPHDRPFGRVCVALDPDGQPVHFMRLAR